MHLRPSGRKAAINSAGDSPEMVRGPQSALLALVYSVEDTMLVSAALTCAFAPAEIGSGTECTACTATVVLTAAVPDFGLFHCAR